MTLQQLRYIVALDNLRHFGEAAEACMVTQPTLTMQLKKLEYEMGVLLFDRSRSPVKTTATGVLVVQHARKMLMEADKLFGEINGIHTQIEGKFRLGVIPTLAPYLLPQFLPKFLNTYKETELDIREMQTSHIIEALKENRIDIGLLVTPLEDDDIREIPIFNEPFLFYGPKSHSLEEIETETLPMDGLLLLEEGHCFRSQMLEICRHNHGSGIPRLHYLSGSIEALKALVRKGLGYTLIPALSANDGDQQHLRKFKTPVPTREVSLVVHHSFVRERLLEVLRTTISESLPSEFEQNESFYKIRWRQM